MALPSGLGRSPSQEMSAADLVGLVRELERCGVVGWLDGGWAVDAALGEHAG